MSDPDPANAPHLLGVSDMDHQIRKELTLDMYIYIYRNLPQWQYRLLHTEHVIAETPHKKSAIERDAIYYIKQTGNKWRSMFAKQSIALDTIVLIDEPICT